MMTHALKTWIQFYKDIESGDKQFELRKDDRDYKVGDTLLLQEFDSKTNKYTGKETTRRINYILRDAQFFGLREGFAILGMKEIEQY